MLCVTPGPGPGPGPGPDPFPGPGPGLGPGHGPAPSATPFPPPTPATDLGHSTGGHKRGNVDYGHHGHEAETVLDTMFLSVPRSLHPKHYHFPPLSTFPGF